MFQEEIFQKSRKMIGDLENAVNLLRCFNKKLGAARNEPQIVQLHA